MEPIRRSVIGPAGEVSFLDWPGDPDLEPVMFLHPVNTAAEIWLDIPPLLKGRRCVAIDYRGHGRSDRTGPFLPADFASDVLAVAADLDLTSTVLVGGSIGGAVAVEVATARPALVSGIAFVGAALHFGMSEQTVEAMAAEVRQRGVESWFAEHSSAIIGPRARGGVAEAVSRIGAGRSADTVRELLLDTFARADSRSAARALIPSSRLNFLVATGEHDPTCPPVMAKEIADIFGVEPIVMAGLGHVPMLEAPAELAEMLRPFFEDIDSPRPSG